MRRACLATVGAMLDMAEDDGGWTVEGGGKVVWEYKDVPNFPISTGE